MAVRNPNRNSMGRFTSAPPSIKNPFVDVFDNDEEEEEQEPKNNKRTFTMAELEETDVCFKPEELLPFEVKGLMKFSLHPPMVKLNKGVNAQLAFEFFEESMKATGVPEIIINSNTFIVTRSNWRLEMTLFDICKLINEQNFFKKTYSNRPVKVSPSQFLHYTTLDIETINYGCINVYVEKASGMLRDLITIVNRTRCFQFNLLCIRKLTDEEYIDEYRVSNCCMLFAGDEPREICIGDQKFDIYDCQLFQFMTSHMKTTISVSKGLSNFYIFIFKKI
jgi:hypothetical protein